MGRKYSENDLEQAIRRTAAGEGIRDPDQFPLKDAREFMAKPGVSSVARL